ncbi:BTAD domain-containing putative transcriptional regulator, partial [Actinomadura sp. CNU-125]|uniref:AfsR/SARP family transcriptional regulator n=1 Tax=Actinomadura sp. CNU-125 TaxID=1904961 RepID=UPI0039673812
MRLRELRLAATEDRIAADLASGDEPGGLVAELEGLAARHPLRERVRTLLVRGLHRDGRDAEALAVFEGFRRVLADELGSDPGDELRAAYLDVLQVPRTRPRGNLRARDRVRGAGRRVRVDRAPVVGRTARHARRHGRCGQDAAGDDGRGAARGAVPGRGVAGGAGGGRGGRRGGGARGGQLERAG